MDIIRYVSLFVESSDVSQFKNQVSFISLGGWLKQEADTD